MSKPENHDSDADEVRQADMTERNATARGSRHRAILWVVFSSILLLIGLWYLDQQRLNGLEVEDAVASLEYGLDRPRCIGPEQLIEAVRERWHRRTAFTALTRLAEDGDATAAYHLARMYRSGIGTGVDQNAAFRWAYFSARLGHEPAYTLVGHIYYGPSGSFRSDEASLAWHELGAELGYQDSIAAASALRLHMAQRDGQTADPEIRATLERIADDGNFLAGLTLSYAHIRGWFGPIDPKETLRWFLRSGQQGHPSNMRYAIIMLSGGFWDDDDGVDGADAVVDLEAAYKWLLVANVWYERDHLMHRFAPLLPRVLLEGYTEIEEEASRRGHNRLPHDLVGVGTRNERTESWAAQRVSEARSRLNERVEAVLVREDTSDREFYRFLRIPYRLSEQEMLRAENEARAFLIENPQPPRLREVMVLYPSLIEGVWQRSLNCSDWRAGFLSQ